MIYFIQAGENGPIKIGQTGNDIQQRMAQLQVGCPYELQLIWIYDGKEYTEDEIHDAFKLLHIRGEWFKPGKDIFAFIRGLANDTEICLLNSETSILVREYPRRTEIQFSDGVEIIEITEEMIRMFWPPDGCLNLDRHSMAVSLIRGGG